jgi:imidazolonepropionase-like amidohydrolase
MSIFTNFCVIFHCLTAIMKSPTLVLCAGAMLLTGCNSANNPQKAITGATLIDGTGGAGVPDAVVVIANGKIVAAGPRSSTTVPSGFTTVDGSGKFIVPGIVDVSVRVEPEAAKATAEMSSYLKAGITTIGTSEKVTAPGPRVFPASEQSAGIADLVIASGGYGPDATLAKIERLAKAEIPSTQVIQAATQNGGAWLKQPAIGQLKAGSSADLILLTADPLADVKNLRKVDRVMLDGNWVATK